MRRCDGGSWRCGWCEAKIGETSGKGPGPDGPGSLCSTCSSRFRAGHTGPPQQDEEGRCAPSMLCPAAVFSPTDIASVRRVNPPLPPWATMHTPATHLRTVSVHPQAFPPSRSSSFPPRRIAPERPSHLAPSLFSHRCPRPRRLGTSVNACARLKPSQQWACTAGTVTAASGYAVGAAAATVRRAARELDPTDRALCAPRARPATVPGTGSRRSATLRASSSVGADAPSSRCRGWARTGATARRHQPRRRRPPPLSRMRKRLEEGMRLRPERPPPSQLCMRLVLGMGLILRGAPRSTWRGRRQRRLRRKVLQRGRRGGMLD